SVCELPPLLVVPTVILRLFFFFSSRRRHTISKRDWSSDVCSSDLLQGLPPGWTDLPGASDSARYKALGNSVPVPCVEYIMAGIRSEERRVGKECRSGGSAEHDKERHKVLSHPGARDADDRRGDGVR